MTIEEFYCKCNNASWRTAFKVYSLYNVIYEGSYYEMPVSIRKLHIGSFTVHSKNNISIHVHEMRGVIYHESE